MKLENDEVSRLSQAFRSRLPSDAPRSDCPPPEHILKGVRQELSRQDLSGLVLHVAQCPLCTQSWKLAEELTPDASISMASAPVLSRPGLRRHFVGAIAAAILLTALSVGLYRTGVFFPVQAPGQVGTSRSVEKLKLELLIAADPLPRDNFLLTWTEFSDASYDVEVYRSNDVTAISQARGLNVAEYRVPQESLAGLPTGTNLQVFVEVHVPGIGAVTSGTFTVRVR